MLAGVGLKLPGTELRFNALTLTYDSMRKSSILTTSGEASVLPLPAMPLSSSIFFFFDEGESWASSLEQHFPVALLAL